MNIGFLIFDRVTQLDFTGPFEVLAALPNANTFIIAASLEHVASDRGLILTPTVTFQTTPTLDIIVVPGGPGTSVLLNDQPTLAFLRTISASAKYIISVCTGALVLAAAGLLQGRRAATHWNAREYLAQLGVTVVAERTVIDLPYISGGGVTAGIDVALTLAVEIFGRDVAEQVALGLEYDPKPPVDSGTPDRARREIVAIYRSASQAMANERSLAVMQAAERLGTALGVETGI